jgi:DNA-binding response OmpR family regulator
MEVSTDNRQKDQGTAFDVSPSHNGLSGFSPSLILLVDDDPDVRSLTRTFLEHEGYSVFSSGDAERAVQIFRNVPQIDLLVTDLYMPGRSGVDLGWDLKGIRSDLPVLLISGGPIGGEEMAKMLEDGWSFLAKPFRLTELLATVHRILAPVEAQRWREEQRGLSVDSLMRDVIEGTNFP